MTITNIQIKKCRDTFGASRILIDMPKRKAWNLLLKNGWEKCPNPAYLKCGRMYAYNNKLLKYLSIHH